MHADPCSKNPAQGYENRYTEDLDVTCSRFRFQRFTRLHELMLNESLGYNESSNLCQNHNSLYFF